MTLASLRAAELAQQKQALQDEFADWRARSQPGQPLEKHLSQIARITRQLDAFLDEIGDAPDSFDAQETYTRKVLGAHRIWAYYRRKLSLRDVAWFRDDLKCADELAWKCYFPAREKAEAAGAIATGALKEPPLVFFSHEASPFMYPRAAAFTVEGITSSQDLKAALLKLAVPVVGVPWFQVHNVASAPVIGHEVGHVVEEDFGLEETIEDLTDHLDTIPQERRDVWRIWSHELFADLYGCLCTGPAYPMALMDYLLDRPQAIQNERWTDPDWQQHMRPYPTRYLRMQFNFAVLEKMGQQDAALEQSWKGTYAYHKMKAYTADIPAVVDALLGAGLAPFGGVPIHSVITFGQPDQAMAGTLAARLNAGLSLPAGQSFRQLVAGATLAFHTDPQRYQQVNGGQTILARMAAAIPAGDRDDQVLGPVKRVERDAADDQTGRALTDLFA
jgi:hypothetical protein